MEIYSVRIKDKKVWRDFHVVCEVHEVEEELERLNKEHPNRNWMIGNDVRFRKFDKDDKCKVGWDKEVV